MLFFIYLIVSEQPNLGRACATQTSGPTPYIDIPLYVTLVQSNVTFYLLEVPYPHPKKKYMWVLIIYIIEHFQ